MAYITTSLPEPLTKNEMKKLYSNWDMDAKNIAIERCMRLAVKIANSYKNTGIEEDELVGTSMEYLVKAARDFNAQLGYEFSTFATLVINRGIQKAIRNSKIHPYPTESLNEPVFLKYNSFCEQGDLIPSTFCVEDFVLCSDLGDIVKNEIHKENERNKKIIYLFLDGMNQEHIGMAAGVTQSCVSRVLKRFKKRVLQEYGR